MSAERRQSPRYTVSIPATVTTMGGQTFECEILDLSETGCRIRLNEAVQLTGPIRLRTENEETLARAIWSDGAFAGLWFPKVARDEPAPGLLRRIWGQLTRSGKAGDA